MGLNITQKKLRVPIFEIHRPIATEFGASVIAVGIHEAPQILKVLWITQRFLNEIKSEVRGKIVDILAENADPVEYGQILLLVEPA